MSRIVVGVDGSAESRKALAWAAEEAKHRRAVLHVVYAYEYTPAWQTYAYGEEHMMQGALRDQLEQEGKQAAARAQALVDRMVDELGAEGVEIEAEAIEHRRPARALLDLLKDADLLVVGSRGRGGFAGLLLGSVSQQCVHHATKPVVVLPGDDA